MYFDRLGHPKCKRLIKIVKKNEKVKGIAN